eukprot:9454235-Pyramimonas_sp.AAC.1
MHCKTWAVPRPLQDYYIAAISLMQYYDWLVTELRVPLKHYWHTTTAVVLIQCCITAITAPPMQHYSTRTLQPCCKTTSTPIKRQS